MDRALRNKKAILAFIAPALIVYSIFVLYPIISTFVYTFFEGMPGMNFKPVGFANFKKLTIDPKIKLTLTNNMQYLVMMVVYELVMGFILALFLFFGIKKGSNLMRTLIFIPVVLPSVATGQMWIKIFEIMPQNGLLNSLLDLFGLDFLIQPWLGQTDTAIWCAGLAAGWKSTGMYVVIFYTGLAGISQDYLEAASIDGATFMRKVRSILFPMLKPIFTIALVLSLSSALRVYDSIYVLTNGGPGYSTYVPLMYMYNTAFGSMKYGYGSTIGFMMLVISLTVSVVITKAMSKDNTI